jgi:copper chaperone
MLDVKVDGMTCDHCADAVTRAVRAVPGARDVVVDLKAGRVRVQGDPDPMAVRAAIEEDGYTVADLVSPD